MAGFNRWTGLGNLGQDAELRHTRDGAAVLTFSLACSETWKDQSGRKQEKTEWVRCVMFGKRAPSLASYLSKGTKLLVTGKLSTSSYEDREGVKRYKTEVIVKEVVFAGSKGSGSGGGRRSRSDDADGVDETPTGNGQYSGPDYEYPDDDSDIPFIFCESRTRERWWRW